MFPHHSCPYECATETSLILLASVISGAMLSHLVLVWFGTANFRPLPCIPGGDGGDGTRHHVLLPAQPLRQGGLALQLFAVLLLAVGLRRLPRLQPVGPSVVLGVL